MSRNFLSTAMRRLRGILESIERRRQLFWINRIDFQIDALEEQRRDIESRSRRLLLRRADLHREMHTVSANVIAFPDRRSKAIPTRPLGRAVR